MKRSPAPTQTALQRALLSCYHEGLGHYRSLSPSWFSKEGLSPLAKETLDRLMPLFVSRMIALSKAPTPEKEARLNVNMVQGNFRDKWGALTVALWLAREAKGDDRQLQRWVRAGPKGVLELAAVHLPNALAQQLRISLKDSGVPKQHLERVTLGGVAQTIWIPDPTSNGPLLLFLHGGPGNSEMPLSHHWAPALSSRFVVVHWDQRGAGRSFSSALQPSQLSLEQLIEDAVELVKHLKTRFADRPIVLLGQSWGTLLGAHIAAMRPELFCAYVGVGQMVDAQENLRLSHRFALGRARRTQHKTALSRLNQMKPPTAKDIPEVMRWVTTFGGSLKGQKDHRLLEKIRARSQVPQTPSEKTFADQAFSMGVLAPAIMQLNLMERIPKFRLPVIFMAGRHDHVTPSALAKRYLDRLKAPEKRFIWFENSAHYPHIEQTKRFAETMTNAVLSHCSNL